MAGGLYDSPSHAAILGTDYVGHDVFANLIYGTRTSLIVGLFAGPMVSTSGVTLVTV